MLYEVITLAAAAIAAILYFAPLYLDGLAANWEIIVFFLGVVLIALEIFVIPGFGHHSFDNYQRKRRDPPFLYG